MPLSPLTQFRIQRANPRSPSRATYGPATGLDLEALTLPDEDPDQWRALLDAWIADDPPTSIGDRALVERVALAAIDQRRCLRARTSLMAEKVRTAALRFDQAQRDEVEAHVALLADEPDRARAGLHRTAAGCRHLIGRWERLAAILEGEGTWYGHDRDEATRLQGARAGSGHLAASETAYLTWLYCLLAQPEPKPIEVSQMGDPAWMPQAFRDHDPEFWIPYHRQCPLLLADLVAHELAPLRARERWLREHVEGPAREAAREQARALVGGELALLRAEQLHDQAFHRAYRALRESRRSADARGRLPIPPAASRPAPAASRPPRPGVLTGPPPGCDRGAGAVLDYHAARRAVLAVADPPES